MPEPNRVVDIGLKAELKELVLSDAEIKAVRNLNNHVLFTRGRYAEHRAKLETALGEIDRSIAQADGTYEGGLKMILDLHGLEGNWKLDESGSRFVRVATGPPEDSTQPA